MPHAIRGRRLTSILPLVGLLAGLAAGASAQSLIGKRMLADANGDGKVSLEEYQTSRRDYIMKMDRNKDGKVSKEEWDRAAAALRRQFDMDGIEGAEVIGKSGWWEGIDANRDGFIDRKEAHQIHLKAMQRVR